MNSDELASEKLARIADILPPPQVVSSSGDFLFYVLWLIVFILILAGVWYVRSGAQQLRRLSRQYQQGKIDNRTLAFQLSRLLCRELQIQHNRPTATSAQFDTTAWQTFSDSLQAACFSRDSLNKNDMNKLLDETAQWLQRR